VTVTAAVPVPVQMQVLELRGCSKIRMWQGRRE
jgi:hypothetical protein